MNISNQIINENLRYRQKHNFNDMIYCGDLMQIEHS